MAYGKSIELFLVNGTADSLIIAELSNWNGKALKYHVLRSLIVIVMILPRRVYTSCFARKMMDLTLCTLGKQKMLKKDSYSI